MNYVEKSASINFMIYDCCLIQYKVENVKKNIVLLQS